MTNRSSTYEAIRKLLASLQDPFTRFLEPAKLAALRRGTAGVATESCSCPTISAFSVDLGQPTADLTSFHPLSTS